MKTLKDFAIAAGVTIKECDPEWGGKVAYSCKAYPTCTIAGFRTEASAYKHWAEDTFGEETTKVLLKLLKKVERLEKKTKKVKV